jgi:hypothetical protein
LLTQHYFLTSGNNTHKYKYLYVHISNFRSHFEAIYLYTYIVYHTGSLLQVSRHLEGPSLPSIGEGQGRAWKEAGSQMLNKYGYVCTQLFLEPLRGRTVSCEFSQPLVSHRYATNYLMN